MFKTTKTRNKVYGDGSERKARKLVKKSWFWPAYARALHGESLPSPEEQMEEVEKLEWIISDVDSTLTPVWLTDDDGKIIGYLRRRKSDGRLVERAHRVRTTGKSAGRESRRIV